ncbi:MAG: hypothetical protein K8L97_26740 [Anaerolineae bacterium]|nr:hypothetical protein [Anaerolineae bacterium]
MNYSSRIIADKRRRNWRTILVTIIIITIPFYCVGLFLWGTAPPRATPTPNLTAPPQIVTATIATATPTVEGGPSITPLPITIQPTGFFPTDIFVPTLFPTAIQPTRFLSPTPTFLLPTNPPPPTQPPALPTETWTPLPFSP